MSASDMCKAQRDDPSVSYVISCLEGEFKPSFREASLKHPDVKLFLREWEKLELCDGLLYRKWNDGENQIYQLVLPEKFRER